jgi:2-polyprenyl-3-methyl-5-hydroxy-6-metoxy-1,4-benzoquinol methylase
MPDHSGGLAFAKKIILTKEDIFQKNNNGFRFIPQSFHGPKKSIQFSKGSEQLLDKVIRYYQLFDEWGRLDRESLEFQINWHFIRQYLPPSGNVLDNGAGPGKYSMALAKLGYRVTLTDITPRLVDIARNKAAELRLTDQFDGFYIADARDLKGWKEEHFDAVLMMGPLYHLQAEEERIAAVKEL